MHGCCTMPLFIFPSYIPDPDTSHYTILSKRQPHKFTEFIPRFPASLFCQYSPVECLADYLHTCQMDGDDIPRPSKLTDIDSQAIAKDLDPDAPVCESLVSMVSVDAALYAKEHFEKSVKKTLTIPAWLNNAALEKF